MILSKLRLLSFVMAFVITILTIGILTTPKAVAASGEAETTPGYKLVNTYDSEKGIITSDIYLTDGLALVGQFGLCYDTELVTLAIPWSDGRIITEYGEQMASGKLKLTHFVTADNKCVLTSETNPLSELINEEDGEFFFAWYAPGSDRFDASETDQRICSVTFKVNDGVTREDLEKSCGVLISFASHTPSDTDIIGYSSGAYCANENTTALRNGDRARKRITLYTEYQGLDIPGGFDISIGENDKGIAIPATYGTTKRIMTVPLNTAKSQITELFTLPKNMTAEFASKDGEASAEILRTGDSITFTKGNMTETVLVAAKSDTDGDGSVTMADLNALMRVISGNMEDAPEEAMYTVDTNGDKLLTKEEYNGFVADIIGNNN